MNFTPEELTRYDRQIRIRQLGKDGQERLKQACIAVAGAGGLGSPAAMYLAAAGVGRLRIIDSDTVETGNLNRQLLHGQQDEGRPKTESAKETLTRLNPDIRVEVIQARIVPKNAQDLFQDCQGIVDAMDNIETRYILNQTAISLGIPLFHGAVNGFEGQAMTVLPGTSACLYCLYGKPVQNAPKEVIPVIGVTPGVIGTIQATEVIKFLTGTGDLLTNRLIRYDGLAMAFKEFGIRQRPDCGHCGHCGHGNTGKEEK
ncbi:MAG: HesA/MoeB/ThiF family protein [Desulfobacterales bacterium]|nr:HesA/MoeB/ThiF family protein [Desulfobacterales bacterium]